MMRRAIARKRDGEALDGRVWREIVASYLAGAVDDAQLAALLMASTIRGLDDDETAALTSAFVASGETLHAPDARTVDKHSSGGVADTASLIVVPLVAACGVPVAKLSGRALGHTGGTLDKLEALPGLRTDLAPEAFFAIVARVGCAIAAQSARLVPADKRIYALRDRTSTVPAPGLIAASIVSKKIAGGARAIVYDVKCGNGAFVHDVAGASALARSLVTLTRAFGRRARAIVSDMNEPLGRAIGTGLELGEARDLLRGTHRDPRLLAIVMRLGSAMLEVAAPSGFDAALARTSLEAALRSGRGYETFVAMLVAQGGSARDLDTIAPHPISVDAVADRDGYVTGIETVGLGDRARDLVAAAGARAGIVVGARIGDRIARGEALAVVYGDDDAAMVAALARCFTIGDDAPQPRTLVYDETGEIPDGVFVETGAASAPARSTLERK
jgi:pyrimidine-nucleoside phosphorylase